MSKLRKIMKKKIFIVLLIFVIMQLFRPSKNRGDVVTNDMSNEFTTPVEVQQILKTSCADCHSNKTYYPWYAEVAPVSWYVAFHVKRGKEHFNASEWMNYNQHQKKHIIKYLHYAVKSKRMPLKSYLFKHHDAALTSRQREVLLNWIATLKVE